MVSAFQKKGWFTCPPFCWDSQEVMVKLEAIENEE